MDVLRGSRFFWQGSMEVLVSVRWFEEVLGWICDCSSFFSSGSRRIYVVLDCSSVVLWRFKEVPGRARWF